MHCFGATSFKEMARDPEIHVPIVVVALAVHSLAVDPRFCLSLLAAVLVGHLIFHLASSRFATTAERSSSTGLQTTLPSEELMSWLRHLQLQEYADRLLAQGYDDLSLLKTLSEQEVTELMHATCMLPGHGLRLRRHLCPSQPIIGATATGDRGQNSARQASSPSQLQHEPCALAARSLTSDAAVSSTSEVVSAAQAARRLPQSASRASAPSSSEPLSKANGAAGNQDAMVSWATSSSALPVDRQLPAEESSFEASASNQTREASDAPVVVEHCPENGEGTSASSSSGADLQGQLEPGTRVRVQGLVSKPEHNSQHGQVRSYDARRARYAVRLDNGTVMSIKLANLHAFAGEPKDDIPDEFVCCITKEMMRQPVITADGHTYDRHAIREWLERRQTSPRTGSELQDLTLRPNHALRAQIIRYREEHNLEPLPAWEPEAQEVVVPRSEHQSPTLSAGEVAPGSGGGAFVEMVFPHPPGAHPTRNLHINGRTVKEVVTLALARLPDLHAELGQLHQQRTGAAPESTSALVDFVMATPPMLHRVMQAIERHPELQQVLTQAFQEATGIAGAGLEGSPGEPPLFACIRAGAVTAVEGLLPRDPSEVSALRTPSGDSLLHVAAWEGQRDVVRLLIARRADPTTISRNRSTALHYACWNNHADVAATLLDASVGIEQRQEQGDTALIQAAFRGSNSCLQLLLERKADSSAAKYDGDTAIHFAAQMRHKETMDLLLAVGTSVNALNERRWTPLRGACFIAFHEGIRSLLEKQADPSLAGTDGETPLHAACHHNPQGACPMVEMLLEHKADAGAQRSEDGFTCLHLASAHGSREVLELLLKAAPDAVQSETPDKKFTPLHVASLCQRESCVSALLEARADHEVRNHLGFTPLHLSLMKFPGVAARCPAGHAPPNTARFGSVTQLLISARSNLDAQGSESHAPIHLAVLNDRHAGLAMLLQSKADAEIQNVTGDTALHLAARHGSLQCTELLLRHHCTPGIRNGANFTPEDVAQQANHTLIAQMIQEHMQTSSGVEATEVA